VALRVGLVALGSRHYLPVGSGVMHSMGQRQAEPPQDYGDLVRLVRTLRVLEVREPEQQAIRDDLLAKLTTVAPSMVRSERPSDWCRS
jgi:hypothetical protein